MKDYEKEIVEAADLKYTTQSANPPYCEIKEKAAIRGFIEGAKSEAAKEYWQQGMYSEDDLKNFSKFCKDHCSSSPTYNLDKWLEQNKKNKALPTVSSHG